MDTQFHDALYDASRSRVLRRILRPLHHKIMRYRKASLEQHESRLKESVEEHIQILGALETHDEDKVETLMMVHIQHAQNSISNIEEEK